MIRIICFLALGAAASCAWACDGRATFTSTDSDGRKSGLFLTADHFLGSPVWSPESGEPPLSVGRAVSIALDWAKRAMPNYDGASFDRLSIQTYTCRLTAPRWYYLVSYVPIYDGNKVHGASSYVAVLMDGSVVEPRDIEE